MVQVNGETGAMTSCRRRNAHRRTTQDHPRGPVMPRYFQSFRVFGEVADLLLLERPERRLLVDISLEPAQTAPGRNPYPHRTTFTLSDPVLMERFLGDVSLGDAIEAHGTFAQADYVPHRTTCIDTTFLMLDYRRVPLPEQLIPATIDVAMDALRRVRLH